jgi:hypothetical protein
MHPKVRNRVLKHDLLHNKHYIVEGGGVGDTMEIRKRITDRNGDPIQTSLNGVTGVASYK